MCPLAEQFRHCLVWCVQMLKRASIRESRFCLIEIESRGGAKGKAIKTWELAAILSSIGMKCDADTVCFVTAGWKHIDGPKLRHFRNQLVCLDVHENAAGKQNIRNSGVFDRVAYPLKNDFFGERCRPAAMLSNRLKFQIFSQSPSYPIGIFWRKPLER